MNSKTMLVCALLVALAACLGQAAPGDTMHAMNGGSSMAGLDQMQQQQQQQQQMPGNGLINSVFNGLRGAMGSLGGTTNGGLNNESMPSPRDNQQMPWRNLMNGGMGGMNGINGMNGMMPGNQQQWMEMMSQSNPWMRQMMAMQQGQHPMMGQHGAGLSPQAMQQVMGMFSQMMQKLQQQLSHQIQMEVQRQLSTFMQGHNGGAANGLNNFMMRTPNGQQAQQQ